MKPVTSSRTMQGFTLTELLIVVVIIGVLAAIALPAYQNYSRTSKRSDAHEGLSRMAQLQERFFTDNNTYATNATALGYATATPESNGGYWALSITQGGATYALQAAPTGGHQDPECLTITLNSAGQRGSTPAGGECWSGK